ncbi:unnamed protein product [Didymodactylos carnosus]|uniref:Uncharacterized protein n=1 Tax=Didymodactylos carnosus TaxID=1234261 RepID=A0A816FPM4_9BILA|nr:unnamed protein product [Didymodactylos carnosus]CAF4620276.1 unnamed protein product [Didymodactylos carnosus]
MAFAFINFTFRLSNAESDQQKIIAIVAMLAVEVLLALLARKLWLRGEKLDIQFFEKYRSPKQKYIDATEIYEILSK